MAVNTTGVSPAANWITDVWPDELSDQTQSETVLSELVDRTFETAMKQGDVIRIPDKSNPAVRVKSQDTSATWSNRTETQQSITVNRQAYCAFLTEDIAEIQAKYDLRASITADTGYSLTAFMEGDVTSGLASLGSGFTTINGTLLADPADDDIIKTMKGLDDGDVPRSNRYIWASPGFHAGLLKIDKFVNMQNVGDSKAQEAILEAKVGRIYGFNVYVSALASNNPGSSGGAYTWFGHKRGVALIQQRKPTVHVDYVILEIGTGVLVDTIYQFATRLIAPSTLGGGTSTDRFMEAIAGP